MALETGRGVRIASIEDESPQYSIHLRRVLDVGAVLGLPLHGSVRSHGALVVARRRGLPAFDLTDLELSESFAAQAAIAMELAQARADQQRLVVLQDRERIARDLHDHVIQRLFASGLTLEGLAGSLPAEAAARLVSVVDELDVTIRQIRNLIFRLQPPGAARGLRSAVLEVVTETAPVLGFEPEVGFEGPVDTVAGDGLVDDVVAVVREALTNVVRHARASRVVLHVGTVGRRAHRGGPGRRRGPAARHPAQRAGQPGATGGGLRRFVRGRTGAGGRDRAALGRAAALSGDLRLWGRAARGPRVVVAEGTPDRRPSGRRRRSEVGARSSTRGRRWVSAPRRSWWRSGWTTVGGRPRPPGTRPVSPATAAGT